MVEKNAQWSEITIPDTSALATKTEIADMATQTWVGEQGYLTEHQDISNLATKEELASKANTSDLSNYLTTANASTTYETISGAQSKYQPVGEYALKSEIPSLSGYATESYVNTQVSNLVNSAPETLDTLKELADALGNDANFSTTVTNLIGAKVSTSAYNADKATFALKSELPDTSNMLTKSEASSTYALKTEIPTDYLTSSSLNGYATTSYVDAQIEGIEIPDVSSYLTKSVADTYYQARGNYATNDYLLSQLSTKQNALTSGSNIKTINGESILGAGDITVSDTYYQFESLQYNDFSGSLPSDKSVLYYNITNSNDIGVAFKLEQATIGREQVLIIKNSSANTRSIYIQRAYNMSGSIFDPIILADANTIELEPDNYLEISCLNSNGMNCYIRYAVSATVEPYTGYIGI